jgi:xylulokinase
MSVIGIDVGSSVTKVIAFATDGRLLADAHESVGGTHTQDGQWEVDASAVLAATWRVLRAVARHPAVRRDPPTGLAVSASGREVVPVAADGTPLGPLLRTADRRAAKVAARADETTSEEEWVERCGHVPDHMDPMNRMIWWRETHRDTYDRTHQFRGWHELITGHLCARAVSDHGLAGKCFAYDLATRDWSQDLLDTFQIEARLLPEVLTWGEPVGVIDPAVATDLSLPAGVMVGTGGFDTSCAALGSGAAVPGVIGLVVGSWESLVAPIDAPLAARDVIDGRLAIGPHPGPSGLGVFALSPNGTVAVDRIRDLTSLSIIELTARLDSSGPAPSPVLAIPHLSGAEGTVLGISLATTKADVAKAVMEGIAFDLALTIDRLRSAGAAPRVIRATGGGSRSNWWMQLKADLTGVPFEVVDQPEAGALGAAIAAGLADRTYPALEPALDALVRPARVFEPDAGRRDLYAERLDRYRTTVEALIDL